MGDVKRVLAKLTPEIGECESHDEWFAQIEEWKREFPLKHIPTTRRPVHPRSSTRSTRRPRGRRWSWRTSGQHQMFAAQYYKFEEPDVPDFGRPRDDGLLAAGAIGAQCAAGQGSVGHRRRRLLPDEPPGAGGADPGADPGKIAVVNNGYLGMVRQWQQLFWAGNYQHVDLSGTPDYVKLADAYGIPAGASPPRRRQVGDRRGRAHPAAADRVPGVPRGERLPDGAVRARPSPRSSRTRRTCRRRSDPVPAATAASAAPTPVHAQGGSR